MTTSRLLAGASGYSFKDPDALQSSIKKITLKAAATAGGAGAKIQGGGALLPYAGLPPTTDLRAQLVRSGGPLCWESVFDSDSVQQFTSV